MLKRSGLSGAPCGTPAEGVKDGPMKDWILILMDRF